MYAQYIQLSTNAYNWFDLGDMRHSSYRNVSHLEPGHTLLRALRDFDQMTKFSAIRKADLTAATLVRQSVHRNCIRRTVTNAEGLIEDGALGTGAGEIDREREREGVG